MSDFQNRLEGHARHRRALALTALVGILLLLGSFCHYPEALGFATGHTHLGQPSVEHCWTSIASLPTLGFMPTLVVLLSFTLTLQTCGFFESPFKPPRALLSPRR